MTEQDQQKGILIPMEKLSKEALDELINEFILREGTDYGQKEYSLDEKRGQILNQLKAKHIRILFDVSAETTTLLKQDEIIKLRQKNLEILGE